MGSGPNNRIVLSDVQKALGLLGTGGAPQAIQSASHSASLLSPTPSAPSHAAATTAQPSAATHASNTKLEVRLRLVVSVCGFGIGLVNGRVGCGM